MNDACFEYSARIALYIYIYIYICQVVGFYLSALSSGNYIWTCGNLENAQDYLFFDTIVNDKTQCIKAYIKHKHII